MSTQLPSTQLFNGFYYFKLHGYIFQLEYVIFRPVHYQQKKKKNPVSYYGWI